MAEGLARPAVAQPVGRRRGEGAPRGRPRPARPPLAVVHDTRGPRVRLGAAWFALVLAAALTSRLLLALVLAGAAALAADQLVRLRVAPAVPGARRQVAAFRDWTVLPMRLPAAVGAASLPLAAAAGTRTFVSAVPALVIVVLVFRALTPDGPSDTQARAGAVRDVATTVAFSLAMGVAAAAPVLAAGLGTGAVLLLVVLVAAYDAGDFLVGSGAGNHWEGPAAGVAAVLVHAFAFAVLALPPVADSVWLLASLLCVLAPIGPPAASVLIGDGRTPAGFVRRLDSLLVAGPVWVWVAATVAV